MTTGTKSARSLLRETLVERYNHLRDRLAIRLGSRDLAGEALHETWLKLQNGTELAPVADPGAYLYRAAINTASNLAAADRRVLGEGEIKEMLEVADEAPGPERIVIGRSELAHVWRVLDGMTVRQRDVFLEVFAGSATHEELAERHGVSLRMIQRDLRDAILYCARKTRRKNPFARGASRVSTR